MRPALWIRRAAVLCSLSLVACSSDSSDNDGSTTDTGAGADVVDDTTDDVGADTGGGEDTGSDTVDPPVDVCAELELPVRAFDANGGGTNRRDVAGDFTVPLTDGTEWTLSEHWTGCETYVFIPDSIPIDDLDSRSIWVQDGDVLGLIERSPRNVHYFFVSRGSPGTTGDATDAMTERVNAAIDSLPAGDALWWSERLHVVDGSASALDGWLATVLSRGMGQLGFGIDRWQQLRGVGSLADVTRFDADLQAQELWPWERNMAYVAHEPWHWNVDIERQAALDAVDATEVVLWDGDILEEFEDIEVELPSAAEMATFDTLEIDVSQRCPDASVPEVGNCGAWDYLAHLYVFDGEEQLELARFITTYHREGRFIVDATPMLVHLQDGGSRTFRWSFAPSWNTQPTATNLTLRFSNQGKGMRPVELVPLWSGGAFNSGYNDTQDTVRFTAPADAAKVELFAIITGHGADTDQCAEFCNHQHEFNIGRGSYVREHPTVGNQEGCIAETANGMTPNQWGTWWFGRGGWCPGQQVEPFVVDITEDITLGEETRARYFGLLRGQEPPDNAGNIVMTSHIVIYEAM